MGASSSGGGSGGNQQEQTSRSYNPGKGGNNIVEHFKIQSKSYSAKRNFI